MDTRSMDQLGSAAALAAAVRTGVLAELLQGRFTVEALAERLKLDRRALALLLDVLVADGWARRDGDMFGAGDALSALSESPGGTDLMLGMWAHLETFLRTGQPFVRMDHAPAEREVHYRKVVGSLGALFDASARDLAERLPLRPLRILDVGCGSGVWSLAAAARIPEAQVTGLDLPAVLEQFQARAAALGLESRITLLPGDMHTALLPPQSFDLIIIANVLRLEPPAKAESLVRRLAAAVAPDGALLVIDALAAGTPQRERARAAYAMNLGLRTQQGQVHAPEAIRRWLIDAGLPHITALDVADGAGAVGALLARAS